MVNKNRNSTTGAWRILFVNGVGILFIGLLSCTQTDRTVYPAGIWYENTTVRFSSGSCVALAYLHSLVPKIVDGGPVAPVTIDYPFSNAVFPPDIVAPTLLWHDTCTTAAWLVQIRFDGDSLRFFTLVDGVRPVSAPPDSMCIRENNRWEESAYQKSARGWTLPDTLWAVIRERSAGRRVHIAVSGVSADLRRKEPIVSRGMLTFTISRDPVAAPVFYRDVPLMPVRNTDGVIEPLSPADIPSIAWRLRDIAKPDAPVVMKRMPTCINCHSFSADGRMLGMDMDGPRGDKGAYTLMPTARNIVIQQDNVFSWNRFNPEKNTFGMFSQVSPDGKYVVSSVEEEVHVVNYTDFRYLQTFYPTRGKIAFYDRAADTIMTLRGADDDRFVQCNPVWSPDGKWVAFLRAPACNAFGDGPKATAANDPRETQIRYDLYRVPFNGGAGGTPEPLQGACGTGKSVSFPRYSPDGKWIVFVEAANGLLMRPDSRLFIIPADGGEAHELACNLPGMNSWHSWSPNAKWLVFSSKCFSPFTQMFLTHIDDEGNAGRPVLIPNSTASNRAVNIPEFVNIAQRGIESISAPATDYRVHFDMSSAFLDRGMYDSAYAEVTKAIALRPDYARNYSMLSLILAKQDRLNEAMNASLKAIGHAPKNIWVHLDAGMFLYALKRIPEAREHLALAVRYNPESARAHYFYGLALVAAGKPVEATAQYDEALRCDPYYADAWNNRASIRYREGQFTAAIEDCSHAIGIERKASYFQNRAVAFLSLQNPGRALRDLDSAALIDPEDGAVWYMRGTVLERSNDTETAIVSFDKALTVREPCFDALEPYCTALFSTDRHRVAEQRLSTLITRNPQYVPLFRWRGLADLYQAGFDRAIADFDIVLAQTPDDPEIHYFRGLCLEAQGLGSAAKESFSKSLEFADPESELYKTVMQRMRGLH